MRILMVYPLERTPECQADMSYRKSALKAAELFPQGEFTTIDSLIKLADLKKYHGSDTTEGENMAEIVKYIIDSADVVFFCNGWAYIGSRITITIMNTAKLYDKRIICEEDLK